MPACLPRRGLYVITPDEPDIGRLLAKVTPVLQAGAKVLQYRNKQATPRLRERQALALLEVCQRHDAVLIVNDGGHLAAAVGAGGVHLGRADGGVAAARKALGPAAIVGASCYDDIGLAPDARDHGASYVAFGAFYPSPTKPFAPRAPLHLLQESAALGIPRVAIGGITPDNGRALLAAGADFLAVISGVFNAPDPAAATRAYLACFDPPLTATASDEDRPLAPLVHPR